MATNAGITVEACDFIIGKLDTYSNSLTESDNQIQNAIDLLSDTHRDQNFNDLQGKFLPLWADILKFKEAVDQFQEHMKGLKKQQEIYMAETGSYNP